MEKLKNIQALRAVAALLVLSSHIQFPLYAIQERDPAYVVPAWLHNSAGAIGVDIFFVISGYVICLTAARHGQDAWHFFRNRFARIVPLHYFLTLVLIAYFWRQWHTGATGPGFGALWNSFFFLPLFDTGEFSMPINSFAWSLCFEMWFYLLFALLLLGMSPRRAALLLPAILLAGALMLRAYGGHWFLPRLLFDPLCLEFGLGCLVFFRQGWLGARSSGIFLGLAALLFLTVVPRFGYLCGVPFRSEASILDGQDYFRSWQRILVWGLPAALLVAGLLGLERANRLVLPAPLVFLGDASFSLYLIQPFTISLALWLTRWTGTTNPFIPALGLFGFTIGLAVLSWNFLERPLTHVARRWLGIAPGESLAGEPTFAPAKPGRGGR